MPLHSVYFTALPCYTQKKSKWGETMNNNVHSEAADRLFDAILTLKDREECYRFFEDICTVNELLSFTQRYEVALMLRRGLTYLEIAELTGASTATISRVNRALNAGTGFCDLSLQRLGLMPGKENCDSDKSDE